MSKISSCLITKFRRIARRASENVPAGLPPVFFCTDEDRNFNNSKVIANLPRGWGVIFRSRSIEQSFREAEGIRQLCKERGVRFLMSKFPEVAKELSADGVHWPKGKIQEARRWKGCFSLMTTSADSYKRIRDARNFPVDAVLFSSVFTSESSSSKSPIGPIKYRLIIRSSKLPVFALAGVSVKNAETVACVGGISAVSGLAEVFDR